MKQGLYRIVACLAALLLISWPGATGAEEPSDQPDLTRLPLGDGRLSNGPVQGSVWRCGGGGPGGPGGGAFRQGPWIHADGTYDLTAKLTVDGEIPWAGELQASQESAVRRLTGNGLPSHTTGIYPVSPSDDAYEYDRNPNRISAQDVSLNVPAMPALASSSSCLTPGAIGMLLTGVVFFDAFDALQRDAVAYEIQDACQGHPERTGQYHYHNITSCIDDPGGGHSPLVGYALDGFGMYGRFGDGGVTLRTTDLDECHGHTHVIDWDGVPTELYHYHATWEFPYTLGCFRGAVTTRPAQGPPSGPGQGPPGGPPQGPHPPRR